ncbi:hypothetical protein [Halomonas organivorans]|uniref:Uncharacterized protein n=1 Tax=Halomonas organivorans TaxID=257772 RepID=A0A7W5BY52_9GAMM|nr:hypothetical protein [Halomonas organivorans]MBB3141172.1 hypothetical protein [Halomonas organivorans]
MTRVAPGIGSAWSSPALALLDRDAPDDASLEMRDRPLERRHRHLLGRDHRLTDGAQRVDGAFPHFAFSSLNAPSTPVIRAPLLTPFFTYTTLFHGEITAPTDGKTIKNSSLKLAKTVSK